MNSTLYQHGTLALLVPGLLKGTITMGELLSHGNTGIGTGEGLDGELVILDGTPYKVGGDGQIVQVPATFTMPFANIHQADYQTLTSLTNSNSAATYQTVSEQVQSPNTFYSVQIKGLFQAVKTRAVNKASRPYPTLVQASQAQSVFQQEQVAGTLVSYYSPEVFHGAAVAGFHSHFLADDLSIGGHVLDFTVEQAAVTVQIFDTLQQHLPVGDIDYMQHDFSADNVAQDISTAEQ
ncbi:acetolactate decarboxylase [Bombilactobacillus thymidiniphilus]|uniref:Alpha-acetolactate decarboxylase n=1 Tax=Bombilactobacillus thymidiniphilus TaxID=2923363 RepID=A0ABY4PBP7_9LACO|nr:acetolactate decarboxylase [Bombilactobacillus thymidiniphilus]UQS83195.1 acetolactate decarboxylase [Bombilactobacillus thymidiniphilus]